MLMVGGDWTRQGLWLRDYPRLNPKPNSNGRYQTLNANNIRSHHLLYTLYKRSQLCTITTIQGVHPLL